ncbi:MAG: TetR/AcrR family transcriptional regulator, partial [Proteobacteria bacterium]|nr:TetR/AcrR family transcriptional regulator [Pseudomonadota bacterium]
MKPKNQPHQNKVGKPSLQQAIKDAGVYEQLLSVGKKHFLANGVKSLVIRKVVAEANVNLGSFVYYFESKENFIEQVIRSHYEDFLKSFSEQVQPLESKAEPIE